MRRCVNIDWLQVYGRCGIDSNIIDKLQKLGCRIKEHDQTTRHFAKWITVTRPRESHPYVEITYQPFSTKEKSGGVFFADACVVKLCNRFCYEPECVEHFRQFLFSWDFKLISISRIDICSDMEYFDNRMSPKTLIEGFFSCKYWKMRPTKSRSVQKQRTTMDYSYLAFGEGAAPVKTKIYNKSLEMREVKSKPYIQDAWRECQLGEKRDVWRLELSITPDRKNMVDKDTGQIVEVKLSEIDSPQKLMNVFFRYAVHYFKFKINDGKTKKSAADVLDLFHVQAADENYKPMRLSPAECSGRTDKLVLAKMLEMSYHPTIDPVARKEIQNAMMHIAKVKRISIGEIKRVQLLMKKQETL